MPQAEHPPRGDSGHSEGRPAYADELAPFGEPEPVSLVDLLNVLLRRKLLIVSGVLACVVLAVVVTKRMEPTYTTTAQFLPWKDPDLSTRMTRLVGGGQVGSLEDNATSDYYVELLKSRTFLARIARKEFRSAHLGRNAPLVEIYRVVGRSEQERLARAVERLSRSLNVRLAARTKILTLSFSASEPALTADVLNAILAEIVLFGQETRGRRTSEKRDFTEKLMAERQKQLARAEQELSEFARRNAKAKGMPEVEAERERLQRAVAVQEELYLAMRRQYEVAAIEEKESKAAIEVIDRASPPLRRSKPSLRKNVAIAGLGGVCLFVGLAFALEKLKTLDLSLERNRELLEHLRPLTRLLSLPARLRTRKAES